MTAGWWSEAWLNEGFALYLALRSAAAARRRTAVELARDAQTGKCPIRGAPSTLPGWVYNATLWAPLVDAYLAPWARSTVTATVLDLAFWEPMYRGSLRQHALPGMHVSVRAGQLHLRTNAEYRMPLFVPWSRSL